MIKYKKGYKYQLIEDYTIQIKIHSYFINTQFIGLSSKGFLVIRSGYAWDGASGPTIDTENSIRGSLVHDALYQLMRQEHLPQSIRSIADERLKTICIEDGMFLPRAETWKNVLSLVGAAAANPKNKKEIFTAGRD